VEVSGELVDPLVEFFLGKSVVFTGILGGSFFNPGPVFIGWGIVSGLGVSFEGVDELMLSNLTVVIGVNGIEDGFGFLPSNTFSFSFSLEGDSRDGSDEGNSSEFHL